MGSGTVNKVILLGRLGKDPEIRYTPSGAAVADFSLATNRVWRNQENEQVKETDWHNVVVWRKWAEFAQKYLKKGSLVYVEGRLQTRKWTDQNEVTHYKTEIIAEIVQMVGPKSAVGDIQQAQPAAQETSAAPPPEADVAPEEPVDDDLPF
ncbi:MAG: single-stranded DNA-binding protein [Calditrichaeota bacterium]|nr:single-stranded DNA-binding protein [Calditrichota bacterium]